MRSYSTVTLLLAPPLIERAVFIGLFLQDKDPAHPGAKVIFSSAPRRLSRVALLKADLLYELENRSKT
jgi:hypothetical protein